MIFTEICLDILLFMVENFAKQYMMIRAGKKKGQEDILTGDWNLLEFDDNVKSASIFWWSQ